MPILSLKTPKEVTRIEEEALLSEILSVDLLGHMGRSGWLAPAQVCAVCATFKMRSGARAENPSFSKERGAGIGQHRPAYTSVSDPSSPWQR
jgi:hypothetical protein